MQISLVRANPDGTMVVEVSGLVDDVGNAIVSYATLSREQLDGAAARALLTLRESLAKAGVA